MAEIVKALKTFTYLDQAPVQNVDIHAGLDNTLVILRNKLKQGVNVHRDYAADLPLSRRGSELNQVWTNIIDNAIQAMDGHGDLYLRTLWQEPWVVVEIEDNGPGIPAEIQPRLFDPFFTTKPPGGAPAWASTSATTSSFKNMAAPSALNRSRARPSSRQTAAACAETGGGGLSAASARPVHGGAAQPWPPNMWRMRSMRPTCFSSPRCCVPLPWRRDSQSRPAGSAICLVGGFLLRLHGMQFVLDFMPDCGDVSAGLFDRASKSAAIAGLTICCALMVLLLFPKRDK
ncbi:MAG: ATP-binding protein [Caldilineaceae bacterium]